MKASIISIGDEVLIGQIVNTNAAWLGNQLSQRGVDIDYTVTIRDEEETIYEALKRVPKDVSWVFITGGLGPTKDDVTKIAIAKFLDCGMSFSQDTYDNIKVIYKKLGKKPSKLHREQSYMPEKVELLNNNLGTAPGMLFRKGETSFVSMPGVPYEMKDIMNNCVLPSIQHEKSIYYQTIMTAGMGETDIAKRIEDIEKDIPEGIKLSYLPSLGSVRLRLTGNSSHKKDIEKIKNKISETLGSFVYGYNDETLKEAVFKICKRKGIKLGTAESCTGGMIAKEITDLSGSSSFFEGSVVSYSNDIKMELLNVKEETLIQHGAVSEQTVREMVNGACHHLSVDVAVAVSGIAGPGGGTKEKPVGTIYIAVGNGERSKVKKLLGLKDRRSNRNLATNIAFNELRKFLVEL